MAISSAVMRVLLQPDAGCSIGVIDVVAERLHFAPAKVWPLAFEAGIEPVFVKCHDFLDAHAVDQIATLLALRAAGSDHVVPDLSILANTGLARSECAGAVEGIGREAKVASYDVGM